jgi:23S rRNA pseudouridine2605 synthase
MPQNSLERISKLIARAGICSRRAAEALILDGKVSYQGKVVEEPGAKAEKIGDILVYNKPLPQVRPRLWLYHKPRGLLVTHNDPQGRPTIYQKLPRKMPYVTSIGRLDQESEGLLLLTNFPTLAYKLEHPSNNWKRVYHVRLYGSVNRRKIDEISQGITIDDVQYKPIKIRWLDETNKANQWVELTLKEGKNREIRKIFEHFGVQVNRLVRVEYGPFALEKMQTGETQEIPHENLSLLKLV